MKGFVKWPRIIPCMFIFESKVRLVIYQNGNGFFIPLQSVYMKFLTAIGNTHSSSLLCADTVKVFFGVYRSMNRSLVRVEFYSNPWDQRLCVVPDGDLFTILREGHASIETDHIVQFTETGVQLKSGKHLDADIIVSATGLNIQILGGIQATIDGEPLDTSKHMLYQGVMLSDVPNMAMIIGYINASWTLKVDVAADYICRLLSYMDRQGYDEVIPQGDQTELLEDTVMGSLSSGYIARAADVMPKQGKHAPWRVTNNYLEDRKTLKQASFEDGILKFKQTVPVQLRKPKLVS